MILSRRSVKGCLPEYLMLVREEFGIGQKVARIDRSKN
jgi:hypothetical protein